MLDMGVREILFILCIYIILGCTCLKYENGPQDANFCEDDCKKIYSHQIYGQTQYSECCERGCRFYNLVNATVEDEYNSTIGTCVNLCSQAYSARMENLTCTSGCLIQLLAQQKRKQIIKPSEDLIQKVQPVMYVQTVYNHVAGSISQFVTWTWTLYGQDDTSKTAVGKDATPLMLDNDARELVEDKVDFGMEEVHQIFVVDSGQQVGKVLQVEESGSDSRLGVTLPSSSERADWLGCLSRQSGLPRKLLLVALLATVVVLVWLSCASFATTPTQQEKNAQVYCDKSYILDCDLVSQLNSQQPSHDDEKVLLSYQECEAPPVNEKEQAAGVPF